MKPLLPAGIHDSLVDEIWKLADPVGYTANLLNAFSMKNPSRANVRSDSQPVPAMELFINKFPGYSDVFFNRADDVRSNIDNGEAVPSTGEELDKLILNFLRQQQEGLIRKEKSGV